ncbi:Zn-dependent metalloprotease [Nocardioides psychrotolerans]|uniref:Zn-dependent metalloprotease n=2 Tax=Nocardioides psychrotolerans TaxID=1005945 RepID=A0A1I3BXU0_9ACTN|nr:Zn-dependent metalloprotease [Nocardioides psychrotolerans]
MWGRTVLAPLVCTSALFLTACQSDPPLVDDDVTVQVLVVSDVWLQGVEADRDDSQARIAALRSGVQDLRDSTGSGWVGRQDDLTGFLTELSGGRYDADGTDGSEDPAQAFVDEAALSLFGVAPDQLALGEPSAPTVTGSATLRAEQQVDGVPVLDGELVLTIGQAADDPSLTAVRGRVFPDLITPTSPTVSAARAARIAARLSGGSSQGAAELVVVPTDTGRLTWRVYVAGTSAGEQGTTLADGEYFIDAATGELDSVRPASAEGKLLTPGANAMSDYLGRARTIRPLPTTGLLDPTAADAVAVSGDDPTGRGPLSATGVRLDDGTIALWDTTVATYDAATTEGGIETYDMAGGGDSDLPGELVTSPGAQIADTEAIGAHAAARTVYDYYAALGRASWDGVGGTLVSSVNYGPSDFCNAFFSSGLQPPQIVYGEPCQPGPELLDTTEVDIDIAGHEITHGVIDTSANLTYSGQSGALNESFADYFGNVIGNAATGADGGSLFEGGCAAITSDTGYCTPDPEGNYSQRYLLNGTSFDDYLRILDVGYRFQLLGIETQDHGGVHSNSAIWNNALWSIRSRLAQIDGVSGNESPLAQDFDKIVYAALTTQLGPTSGYFDARDAVEQTIIDAGADPVVLRTAREIFDQLNICVGCSDLGTIPGTPVTGAAQTQQAPTVSGDQIAWLDLSAADRYFGVASSARVGATPTAVGGARDTIQVAYAGDALVTLDAKGLVSRFLDGGSEALGSVDADPAVAAGLAGSDTGAAWVSAAEGLVYYVDAAGSLTSAPLPAQDSSIVGLGTGDGTVALGTDPGTVMVWTPGQGEPRVLGSMPSAVVSVAAHGDHVVAVDLEGNAALFDAAGNRTELSSSASPFGAAANGDYAIWAESVKPIESAVVGGESPYPDTDLYLYSYASGTIYSLMTQTGQQGFPAISGDRIVWQDAAFGGDDILTATIPSGL